MAKNALLKEAKIHSSRMPHHKNVVAYKHVMTTTNQAGSTLSSPKQPVLGTLPEESYDRDVVTNQHHVGSSTVLQSPTNSLGSHAIGCQTPDKPQGGSEGSSLHSSDNAPFQGKASIVMEFYQ
jgi:hypothetical protein